MMVPGYYKDEAQMSYVVGWYSGTEPLNVEDFNILTLDASVHFTEEN